MPHWVTLTNAAVATGRCSPSSLVTSRLLSGNPSLRTHSRQDSAHLPAPTLTPGPRLGPYEILSALGVGGMAEVYRATDGHPCL